MACKQWRGSAGKLSLLQELELDAVPEKIRGQTVSTMLPSCFEERQIRVFTRRENPSREHLEAIIEALRLVRKSIEGRLCHSAATVGPQAARLKGEDSITPFPVRGHFRSKVHQSPAKAAFSRCSPVVQTRRNDTQTKTVYNDDEESIVSMHSKKRKAHSKQERPPLVPSKRGKGSHRRIDWT